MIARSEREYFWKQGFAFRGEPEPIFRELERIRTAWDAGGIDEERLAAAVWKAARKPQSPLHECFDWDQRKAAERHWAEVAKNLLNAIGTRVTSRLPTSVRVRELPQVATNAFFSFRNEGASIRDPRRYLRHDQIDKKANRAVVWASAVRELRSFCDRYRSVAALSALIETIESFLRRETAGGRRS